MEQKLEQRPAAKGLGKGLSALISEKESPVSAAQIAQSVDGKIADIPLNQIVPGHYQMRQQFDESELNELAESIRANGVVQPILVRSSKAGSNRYELVAGERRWRASQRAGLKTIPALIKEVTDQKAMEIGLIENIQRQNLDALEEANGYQRLIEEFSYTHESLGEVLGKNRSTISNSLRLLQLPDPVKQWLSEDKIDAGHARALLASKDPAALAEIVIKRALNVRQTEQLVKKMGAALGDTTRAQRSAALGKDPEIAELEKEISRTVGFDVVIANRGQSGHVQIAYHSLAELDEILRRIERPSRVGAAMTSKSNEKPKTGIDALVAAADAVVANAEAVLATAPSSAPPQKASATA